MLTMIIVDVVDDDHDDVVVILSICLCYYEMVKV